MVFLFSHVVYLRIDVILFFLSLLSISLFPSHSFPSALPTSCYQFAPVSEPMFMYASSYSVGGRVHGTHETGVISHLYILPLYGQTSSQCHMADVNIVFPAHPLSPLSSNSQHSSFYFFRWLFCHHSSQHSFFIPYFSIPPDPLFFSMSFLAIHP